MTRKPATRQKAAPKPAPAVTSRESLEAQIAAFLNAGGEIQEIDKGVSGQNSGYANRHISLERK